MQLSVSLLSLVYLVVSVLGVDNGPDLAPRAAGFGNSCEGIHIIGNGGELELAATCSNDGGGNNGEVTVPLSQCLINFNGDLFCDPESGGGAMGSCDGCFLDGTAVTVMTCTCERDNGGTDLTTVDLNECIGNNDGFLTC